MLQASELSPVLLSHSIPEINLLVSFFSCQATQLLKFREAPLVVESLASLEKAVPSPKDEEEPVDGGTNQISSKLYRQSFLFLSQILKIDKLTGVVNRSRNFHIVTTPKLFPRVSRPTRREFLELIAVTTVKENVSP